MKVIIASLLLLLLVSCAYIQGPETWPLKYKAYTVTIIPLETRQELEQLHKYNREGYQLHGMAWWKESTCIIWYVHSDYETLIHELKHCYYGKWHEDVK